MEKNIQWIAGIDEAGRGPLAGPLSVGFVAVPAAHYERTRKSFFPEKIKDSKKLKEHAREEIFKKIQATLVWNHVFISPQAIDARGISYAARSAIAKVLSASGIEPCSMDLRLDGLLHAPAVYLHQQTIVKGDEKEAVIALASIVAKVCRDRYMVRVAKKYPLYKFESHKGYGTKAHYAAIKTQGLSAIHRKSFCELPFLTK